jgi:hypothetical protein
MKFLPFYKKNTVFAVLIQVIYLAFQGFSVKESAERRGENMHTHFSVFREKWAKPCECGYL